MSSRAAKVRAVFTAIGVVLGVALLLAVVILVLGGIFGYVSGTLFGGGDETSVQGPEIEIETDVTDDSVTVRHAGGDQVSAAELRFEVDGDDRGTWADHAEGDTDMVSEGASVQIAGVSAGDELVVRWERDTMARVLHRETL